MKHIVVCICVFSSNSTYRIYSVSISHFKRHSTFYIEKNIPYHWKENGEKSTKDYVEVYIDIPPLTF